MKIKIWGWTTNEVSAVLRASEGNSTSEQDNGIGHAESRHQIGLVGRNRAGTSEVNVEARVLGSEREGMPFEEWREYVPPPTSSAFDGCQIEAVTYAFKTSAGQNALKCLLGSMVEYVYAKIDISYPAFSMYEVDTHTENLEPLPAGVTMVASEWGIAMRGLPRRQRTTAKSIEMKLMKTGNGHLHIRTAFPCSAPIAQSEAEIKYLGKGVINKQKIPI